jgi:hypothetical protein
MLENEELDNVFEDATGVSDCLLGGLEFKISSPNGFYFQPRVPSPLVERLEELGGCEMERLTACPSTIGKFVALPVPPLQVMVRTTCCHRCYLGAQVRINGKEAVMDEEQSTVTIARKRRYGKLDIEVDQVPLHLMPDGVNKCSQRFGPEDGAINVDVKCLLWVYWVPSEDDEEEDIDPEDPPEPLPSLVFVAADGEQIPDEARPIAGVMKCAHADPSKITLDGSSMGPFLISASKDVGMIDRCLLAGIVFNMEPPEGFSSFNARDPCTLAERVDQVGGCELQRLVACPTVVGSLKPMPRT